MHHNHTVSGYVGGGEDRDLAIKEEKHLPYLVKNVRAPRHTHSWTESKAVHPVYQVMHIRRSSPSKEQQQQEQQQQHVVL